MGIIEEFVSKYHALSSTSLEKFEELFSVKTFKKNDVLYRSGEASSRFFILTEGVARSMVIDNNGKEKTRTLFTAPIVFTSLVSSLTNEPSNSEFNCLTDVSIFEGNFLEFIKLTEEYHDISILYNKFLEEAFIRMQDKATILSTLNATERYLHLKNQIPNIEKLIQLNHIASYLSITSIQLSRIRKKIYSK
ncbi:MAG: Crp/Fnr family transcriptional regulator [Flavobacteriaceae bacterium]